MLVHWVRKLTALTSRLEFGEWPSASVSYTHALCLRLVYQLLQTPEARPLASRLPTWLTGNRSTASFIVALACPLSTRKFSVAKSWYVYCPVILLAHLLRIGCSDHLIVGHVSVSVGFNNNGGLEECSFDLYASLVVVVVVIYIFLSCYDLNPLRSNAN